jgi:hypothetical protein
MFVQGLSMSGTDLAFEAKLKAIRSALARGPKHLRPTPTCVPIPEAAKRLGVSVREFRRRMSRRRWHASSLDGVLLVPISMIDRLR